MGDGTSSRRYEAAWCGMIRAPSSLSVSPAWTARGVLRRGGLALNVPDGRLSRNTPVSVKLYRLSGCLHRATSRTGVGPAQQHRERREQDTEYQDAPRG